MSMLLLAGLGINAHSFAASTFQVTTPGWTGWEPIAWGFMTAGPALNDSNPCLVQHVAMTPGPVEACDDAWAQPIISAWRLPLTSQGWSPSAPDGCDGPFNCMIELYFSADPTKDNCFNGPCVKFQVTQAYCPVGQFNWSGPYVGKCTSINIPPPKNAGQPCPCQSAGDPINAGAGNKFEEVTDYKGGGAFPLTLVRSYNSINSNNFGPFGYGWSDNLHQTLAITLCVATPAGACGAESITVQRGDGKAYTFTANNSVVNGTPIGATDLGTVWQSDPDVSGKLVTSAVSGTGVSMLDTQFTYTATDGSVEIYNGSGQIMSVTRPGGLTHTYAYDQNGNLTSVSDGFGHSLRFTYGGYDAQVQQMFDPAGRIYTYLYDGYGNLHQVYYTSFSTANRVEYLYENANFPNALTGIIDQNGVRYASWTYDSNGNAITSQNAGGVGSASVVYNQDGSADVTEATGQVRHFTFNTINGVTKLASVSAPCPACGDKSQSATYDPAGYLSSETDFDGNQTNYVFDDSTGLELSRTEAVGTQLQKTVMTQWNTTLRQPTLITEPGRTTAYTYDSAGHVLTSTVTDTATNVPRTTTDTYNSAGLLATVSDPMGHVTSYSYDGQGNLSSITNALGQVTQITQYDANGYPLTMVDSNGVTTTLVYDNHERLTSKTVGGATTQYTYDPVNDLVEVTLPTGSYLMYTYDSARRLTGISDDLGNSIAYTLDNLGNRTQEQTYDPNNTLTKTLQRTYNDLNQLITEIGGASQVTQFSYDQLNNLTTLTDPMSNVTHQTFDALNRLSSVLDPAGGNTAYAYDSLGRVQDVTDPRKLDTHYGYDAFGDVISQQSPDTGTSSYTYDLDGNRLTETDAKGVTATYGYDVLNRLTSITFPDATKDVTYTYDQGTNGIGRLTAMTDSSGNTSYQYDARGNLIQKASTVEGHTFTVAYQYDLGDNLAAITYPDGMQVTYSRDGADRVSGLSATLNGVTQTLVSGISYEPFGPITGLTYGNGLTETRTYDQDYRLTGIAVAGIASWSYTQNPDGDITSIADGLISANSQTFGYDNLNRLTSAQGAYGAQSYVYDSDGNRTQETLGGVSTTLTYDTASNKLLTVGAKADTYDLDGSLTGDGSHTYAYDATERLSGYDNATNAYLYNGSGQRVRKTLPVTVIPGDANGDGIIDQNDLLALHAALKGQIPITPGMDCNQDGVVDMKDNACIAQKIGSYKNQGKNSGSAATTAVTSTAKSLYFVYDEGGHLLGEYDQSGNVVAEHIWLGDSPVAVATSGAYDYVVTDQLGTPRAITDSTGAVVWKWSSDPFGNGQPTGTLTYNLRLPGQYLDSETGHLYNMARDYDPAVGRYVENDPLGLGGGLNTYGYVGGNPISSVDPLGLLQWTTESASTQFDLVTGDVYPPVPDNPSFLPPVDPARDSNGGMTNVSWHLDSQCLCNQNGQYQFVQFIVSVQPIMHLRSSYPDGKEFNFASNGERQHADDYENWANTVGKYQATQLEMQYKGHIYETEAACKALTDQLRPILQTSLNEAYLLSKAKWDDSGKHTYTGGP